MSVAHNEPFDPRSSHPDEQLAAGEVQQPSGTFHFEHASEVAGWIRRALPHRVEPTASVVGLAARSKKQVTPLTSLFRDILPADAIAEIESLPGELKVSVGEAMTKAYHFSPSHEIALLERFFAPSLAALKITHYYSKYFQNGSKTAIDSVDTSTVFRKKMQANPYKLFSAFWSVFGEYDQIPARDAVTVLVDGAEEQAMHVPERGSGVVSVEPVLVTGQRADLVEPITLLAPQEMAAATIVKAVAKPLRQSLIAAQSAVEVLPEEWRDNIVTDLKPYWSEQDLISLDALLQGKEGDITTAARTVMFDLLSTFAPISPLYAKQADQVGLSFDQWQAFSLLSGYGAGRNYRVLSYKRVRTMVSTPGIEGFDGFNKIFVSALESLTLAAVEKHGDSIYPSILELAPRESLQLAAAEKTTLSTRLVDAQTKPEQGESNAAASRANNETIPTTAPVKPDSQVAVAKKLVKKGSAISVDELAETAGLTVRQLRTLLKELERSGALLEQPVVRAKENGQKVAHYKASAADVILPAARRRAVYIASQQNS